MFDGDLINLKFSKGVIRSVVDDIHDTDNRLRTSALILDVGNDVVSAESEQHCSVENNKLIDLIGMSR